MPAQPIGPSAPSAPADARAALGAPGLQIIRSNRVEHLAAVLGSTLRTSPNPDPIAPEVILIGNRGIERWLSHQLAETLGICANVQLLFPARALTEALDAAQPPDAPPASPAWAPDALAWTLAQVLPGVLADLPAAVAAPLRGALGTSALLDPHHPMVDRRAWALCSELAQVFDRIIAFRPDQAQAWSAGHGTDALIPWQPLLWQRVVAHIGAEHNATRLARALPRWQRGEAAPLHPRLHLFGLSVLPPAWITQLLAMARAIPIHLYVLAPSSAWWADLAQRARGCTGLRQLEGEDALAEALQLDAQADHLHPLLRTLGRVPRDLQLLLADLDAEQDAQEPNGLPPIAVDDTGDLLFAGLPTDRSPRLLDLLQADILDAVHPATRLNARPALQADDQSVHVHACHGLLRQVEVLYDALLHAFSDDPSLEPRDVVVLCPDIEAVAPLVQAVFADRQARSGPPAIPFKIADLSVRRLNPVADVLLRTLELAQGRAPASAVLDLLELEPLQRRFGLTPGDVRQCSTLIQAAGVRWAVDDQHRAQFAEQPAELSNTWRFGLDRLLIGALSPDEAELVDGLAPLDAIDAPTAQMVGKLTAALAALFSELSALRAPRPLSAWCDRLDALMGSLTEMDPEGAWLSRRVREGIAALRTEADAARSVAAVDADALRAALTGRFSVPSEPTGLHGGAVTFCALQPMRSVPYAVVALLGMDDGAFPRQTARLGFDPTRLRPRTGDRSPRDEDRALFLEAILAARSRLLVLYSGRDEHSNAERPPAVPVSELLDALDHTARGPDGGALRPHVLRSHTLQAFHPDNFRPLWPGPDGACTRPWSHSTALRAGAIALRGEAEPEQTASEGPTVLRVAREQPRTLPEEELQLDDLVRFFENPARTLLQLRARVQLPPEPVAVSDREPVELDSLERWALGDSLLQNEADAASELARARAEGRLPFGQSGAQAIARERELAEAIASTAAPLRRGLPRTEDLRLALSAVDGGGALGHHSPQDVRIVGRVGPIYDVPAFDSGVLVHASVGREDSKRLLRTYLPHLLRLAASHEPHPRAVLAHGSVHSGIAKAELKGFGSPQQPAQAWAQGHLRSLVALYRAGQRAPLPLLPHASLEFARALKGPGWADWFAADDPPPLSDAQREVLRGAAGKAIAFFDAIKTSAFAVTDIDDPWIVRAWADRDPIRAPAGDPRLVSRAFAHCALTLWEPLLSLRKTTADIVRDDLPRSW